MWQGLVQNLANGLIDTVTDGLKGAIVGARTGFLARSAGADEVIAAVRGAQGNPDQTDIVRKQYGLSEDDFNKISAGTWTKKDVKKNVSWVKQQGEEAQEITMGNYQGSSSLERQRSEDKKRREEERTRAQEIADCKKDCNNNYPNDVEGRKSCQSACG